MLDLLAGMLSTVKACQFLDKHRKFVGFGKEVCGQQKSMLRVVEVYSSQPLNERSDLTSDDQLRNSARV